MTTNMWEFIILSFCVDLWWNYKYLDIHKFSLIFSLLRMCVCVCEVDSKFEFVKKGIEETSFHATRGFQWILSLEMFPLGMKIDSILFWTLILNFFVSPHTIKRKKINFPLVWLWIKWYELVHKSLNASLNLHMIIILVACYVSQIVPRIQLRSWGENISSLGWFLNQILEN